MKKCPACRSISADEETTCGVCGESLEQVSPLVKTLDQSILEDKQENSAWERKFARKEWKMSLPKLLARLSVGLFILGSGVILVNNGVIFAFLLLPFGLWITASVILGGLGPSAWYRLWTYRVFRIPWNWIGSKESEEEDSREKNEKAENPELRGEGDESRREREKSDFD